MSLSPSDTLIDVITAMEALMDEVESALDSAEPEALFTMARHQADLLEKLKELPVPQEIADPLARTLERSRHLALRIEAEMDAIRSLLTASANKKRISGAYASSY
ncbi:hypothetical protein [Desulfoluna limicola]|uniref:hypothetical protein n=1 Tax=Desulfoluna limicola TaxID=2810562 RepID=UPI001F24BDD1|nr:hypothetical protein [Desulfoluna limicola]